MPSYRTSYCFKKRSLPAHAKVRKRSAYKEHRTQKIAAVTILLCQLASAAKTLAELLWQGEIRGRRRALQHFCLLLKLWLLLDRDTLAPAACPAQHAQRARKGNQADRSHGHDGHQRCMRDCRLLLTHDVQGRARHQPCTAALIVLAPCGPQSFLRLCGWNHVTRSPAHAPLRMHRCAYISGALASPAPGDLLFLLHFQL